MMDYAPEEYKRMQRELAEGMRNIHAFASEKAKSVAEQEAWIAEKLQKADDAFHNKYQADRDAQRVTSDSPALKFDSDKHSRPELIAPEMIEALGVVLAYGAKKYADRNWEKGMAWHRPFGALMRHMWAWWKREDYDAETGYSHLWHAACCLMFLIAYETRNVGEDTRWKGGSDE